MSPRLLPLAATLAIGTAACGASSSHLAVDRVVLYQSGVAYLERQGTVVGDELVLQVRPDQINDILGSLVVVDSRGGTATVSLPIDQADVRHQVDVPAAAENGLDGILRAFRGADVTIRTSSRHVRGRIAGVEDIEGVAHVSIVTRGDEIVPVAIDDIDRVEMQSESLAIALERSLDRSLSEGDWKPIDVTIRFADGGRHDVAVAWVVEMPIWKPAYRAVVDDGGLLLQGWAVVDNVSGEDWTGVDLSLTAGTPLSFRYDLHSPVYVDRPDLTSYGRPSMVDLRPPTPMDAVATRSSADGGSAAPAPMAEMAARQQGQRWDADSAGDYYADEGDIFSGSPGGSAVASSAEIVDLAGLFRFDLSDPVTLPDQSSTLVTLVNEHVPGDDVIVFQPSGGASDRYPYRSIRIDNDTPFPVQRAPIAIYRRGTFVGEGITPDIAPGETATIPFAIESRVTVDSRSSSTSGEARLVRIIDGRITIESQTVSATTWTVRSALPEEERVLVRIPRYPNYTLDAGTDTVEEHDGFYLVPIDVGPRATVEQTVTQRSPVRTQIDLFDPRAKIVLDAWLDNADGRPDVAAALRPVLDGLDDLAAAEQRLNELRTMRGEIEQRTRELRANIAALGDAERSAELRQTLVDRLAEQDDLLADTAAEIVERNEEISALRVMLTERMREVSLDESP